MNILTDIFLGVIHLLTAEMGSLRKAILRLGWALAFALLAGLLLFLGAAVVMWSAYHYLVSQFGPPGTGMIIAGMSFLLAALAGKIAQMNAR